MPQGPAGDRSHPVHRGGPHVGWCQGPGVGSGAGCMLPGLAQGCVQTQLPQMCMAAPNSASRSCALPSGLRPSEEGGA